MSGLARVEVLNTGTELLFGSVVNTHVAFLGQQLFSLGLRIARQTTVPDGDAIRDAILEAVPRSDIILITGGLGPTTDDITREVVAEFTGLPLQFDSSVAASIRQRFEKRGLRISDRVLRQAQVPSGAIVLPNDFGTAPGLYLPAANHYPHLFLLPGPPREFRPMFETYAVPLLRALSGGGDLSARIYRVTGIGESSIEGLIGKPLLSLPEIELGYCARVGEVDVRIIGSSAGLAAADVIVSRMLDSHIISGDGRDLETVVVDALIAQRLSLAVAESCTGGLLAHRITNVPGASAIFLEGNVTYSNEAKVRTLNVPNDLIQRFGAVSEEVAAAMAAGARARTNSTFALATTGIAGPGGGTEAKPVGTVYIGLAGPDRAPQVDRLFFPTDREAFKQLATQHALDMLRKVIG
jgi:nicotinamide-nucleotide amidase